MIVAPKPMDESARLQALHALQILDTPSELRFELMVSHLAELLSVPIVLLTLIDTNRQWFKAKHGVDVSEVPRDISVCAHAICDINSIQPSERIYEIYDLLADERFRENPLIIDSPYARSYISYVIQSTCGKNIGTLCMVDLCAREYSKAEKDTIIGVGEIVNDLIVNHFYTGSV